jgi:ketosteroid isomerase-like protein
MSQRTDQLRRLGLSWNEAWNSRDVSRLTRFFAPRSTYYEPSLSGPMPGAEGVTASAEKTWDDWPRAVFSAVTVTVEDPRVVVEWRTSAAHKSGLQHLLEGVDILEVDGDLVTACRVYYDTRVEVPPARRARGGSKRGAGPKRQARGSRPPRPRR